MAGLTLVAALVAATAIAQAEKRLAMVIGNSAYQHTSTLANPRNDATDIARLLGGLGFEVAVHIDLGKAGMESKLRDFSDRINGADVAVFFYAGHGLQVAGTNYLVPVDARLASENDVERDALSLHDVMRAMEVRARSSVVMLDACRNNPLADRLRGASTSSRIGTGLADVGSGAADQLISFSTHPGATAADGRGRNSPYAAAMLRYLGWPGDDLLTTLRRVRKRVVEASAGAQTPWDHNSLRNPILLRRPLDAQADADRPLPPPLVILYDQYWVNDGATTYGSFKRQSADHWTEVVQTKRRKERAAIFHFRQHEITRDRIVLVDADRPGGAMWVRIELSEGRIYWSNDGRRTWNYIYRVVDVD